MIKYTFAVGVPDGESDENLIKFMEANGTTLDSTTSDGKTLLSEVNSKGAALALKDALPSTKYILITKAIHSSGAILYFINTATTEAAPEGASVETSSNIIKYVAQ